MIVGRMRYLDVKDVEMLSMSSKEDSDQIINDKWTIIVPLLIKKQNTIELKKITLLRVFGYSIF